MLTSAETDGAVILITGVMASGKTTVAKELAGRLPRAAHVGGDVFRRMIVSGRAEMLPEPTPEAQAQLHLRQRLSANCADLYAEAGFTAVVQDILLGDDLPAYVARVRARPLYVVVLAPRPEVVAAREAARAKTGYGLWTVEALDAGLRATPRLGLWLDTSDLTPSETVDALLGALPEARVDA
ncbi:AAA family ATPase [Streptomyces marincola]|nr:AAA family ATPase [Streptomyces marincola]